MVEIKVKQRLRILIKGDTHERVPFSIGYNRMSISSRMSLIKHLKNKTNHLTMNETNNLLNQIE